MKELEAPLPWPHAPPHWLAGSGRYFVSASTYGHDHFFAGAKRLEVLHRGLLTVCRDYGWRLEAWAVFSNHYHFVAESPSDAKSLSAMLGELHSKMAKWVNRLDQQAGRKVWFNYRETLLLYQRSYLARLNYTHRNAQKHGLVKAASDYPWCSAAWFERATSPAMVKSVYRFDPDKVKIDDHHAPSTDW